MKALKLILLYLLFSIGLILIIAEINEDVRLWFMWLIASKIVGGLIIYLSGRKIVEILKPYINELS